VGDCGRTRRGPRATALMSAGSGARSAGAAPSASMTSFVSTPRLMTRSGASRRVASETAQVDPLWRDRQINEPWLCGAQAPSKGAMSPNHIGHHELESAACCMSTFQLFPKFGL
jgi:hypothetical protein